MLPEHQKPPPRRPHDLHAALRRVAVFGRLTDEQLHAVARRARTVSLAAGETLFQQGERARAFFLLLDGQVKLYRSSAEGNEVIVDLPDPGTTFAESRLFLEDPRYHLSCAALADSEIAVIDSQGFLAVLRESADTCLLFLRLLSERSERRVEDIDRLALQSSTCRVAGYLLGQLPAGRDEYVLKIAKGVMASRLAIRAETLSRILKQLSEEGVVSCFGRNLVRVHSRERLRRLSAEQGSSLVDDSERRRASRGG